MTTAPTRRQHAGELAAVFLRLGLTAFGGPAAHVALMRQECVQRRGWLTEPEFLDLYGACSLIPGPSSTELAMHLGLRRAGGLGLLIAGTCFILPAALLVTVFAWGYQRYGHLPAAAGLLHGVESVILAVIAQALWALAKTAWKSRFLGFIGLASVIPAAAGAAPLLILLGAGLLASVRGWREARRSEGRRLLTILLIAAVILALLLIVPRHPAPRPITFGLLPLLLVFLKIGATVFGSGYVLLAFLRDDLVTGLHWMTNGQLLDAVAVGQVTPGPVFTTATFIGYLKGGSAGALIATLGIFAPAFAFVAVSGPLVPKIRRSPVAGFFLDGVNAAAMALMAVVTWQLARGVLTDPAAFFLTLASGVLLLRFRVNTAWLVLGGALLGIFLFRPPA